MFRLSTSPVLYAVPDSQEGVIYNGASNIAQDRRCTYTGTLNRVRATSLPSLSRIQSACAVLYCHVACLGLPPPPPTHKSHKPHDVMKNEVIELKMLMQD
jgi:hypothetical protein